MTTARSPFKSFVLLILIFCSFTPNMNAAIIGTEFTISKYLYELINKGFDTAKDISDAWIHKADWGTAEDTALSIWDHVTNIAAYKALGCIMAAAGFATLYQWLGSLEDGKKPVWIKWLQKPVAPQHVAPPGEQTEKKKPEQKTAPPESVDLLKKSGIMSSEPAAIEEIDDDAEQDELTADEDAENDNTEDTLTPEQTNRRARFSRFIGKIIPPTVGTIFALAGLTFILKARAISNFFVNQGRSNQGAKEKATGSQT